MIRFVFIILVFLFSLLSVFKAPAYPLWIAAIIVSEFPWIFLFVTGAVLAWGIAPQQFQVAGNILAAISFILFLSPIVRAYTIANHLQDDLELNFGKDAEAVSGQHKPFQFFNMMIVIAAKKIDYDRMIYATKDSLDLSLDFYPSQQRGVKPCVVVVHGGSWAGGDNKLLPELNSHLANKGYHVAAINYRLAPTYQSPAPVEDIESALSFLRSHSNELQIDTTQFVLLGRSAGGQIALLAAYSLHDPNIKAVISFYGPADMVWAYSIPSNPLIMNSRKVMEDYLGGTYLQVPENYVRSSPINYATKQTIPTLLIHGQNDVLVAYEHSKRLNKKLTELDVPHYLLTLPWATHGCDYTLNGPSGQLSVYSIEYFLRRVVR